ncbi:MAG: hypothetical protein QGI68_19305 [Pseudomonadales bacterium]|nr:hypothetical protein [Pseudomonadales bacterium]MDP7360749.1 hypothetical protein [Pseudomonadales bacterium]MDP7597692.1 hypothetical protein [Pseudomonadales bacterium]HJN50536.1 hypothetical protein [Pseudomonadales bacterium]
MNKRIDGLDFTLTRTVFTVEKDGFTDEIELIISDGRIGRMEGSLGREEQEQYQKGPITPVGSVDFTAKFAGANDDEVLDQAEAFIREQGGEITMTDPPRRTDT